MAALSNKDIQKIITAQEKIFATKEDLEKMQENNRKDFSDLLTAVDKYGQKADTYFQEMVMLSHKIQEA
ncbi:MAG: hypothetical protein WC650_02265 [Candidatus Doudnabacteria bacterium]